MSPTGSVTDPSTRRGALGKWSIGELERFFSNAPVLQRSSSPRLPVLKVSDPVGRQVFAVKRYKIDFIIKCVNHVVKRNKRKEKFNQKKHWGRK
jgi:hypothetical protein